MKTMIRNPFITSGYVSADYFCDRRFESEQLVREVMNGNNLALVSTRRMGKTGLIRHCFQFPEIKQGYYTFFIDIYDSRSLRDLVFALSKEILEVLKPMGKKALHGFWECVKSLQASISFDVNGMPSLNLGLGDIQAPATTLDEIFRYLEQADTVWFKPSAIFPGLMGSSLCRSRYRYTFTYSPFASARYRSINSLETRVASTWK